MWPRCAALALTGWATTAAAIRLKVDESKTMGSMHVVANSFREKIRMRFDIVDMDGDGVVSFAEMKRGFGHEPAHVGESILREMLAECAGTAAAESCTREQLERSLDHWVSSGSARTSLSLLQTDSRHGFVHVRDHRHYRRRLRRTVRRSATGDEDEPDDEEEEEDVEEELGDEVNSSTASLIRGPKESGSRELCGPTVAEQKGKGLENVVCHVDGARCTRLGNFVAWSFDDVCHSRACICEATPEVKRLAKVGLMGAAAVTTAKNFTDPGDEMRNPECGGGWQGWKIVGRMEDLSKSMSIAETAFAKSALKYFANYVVQNWTKEDFADTEAALFKTSTHELVKGRPNGKVCMMSWQATRSMGDWKLNMLVKEMPFKYAAFSTKAPKGLVLSYDSVRPKLMEAFERECCTPQWQAEKIIISGHSHGGAMASLHALDVINNWKCGGRDIGATDLAVIMVAPHSKMYKHETMNKIWSCNDPANCLAGRALVMTTNGDYVGDKVTPRVGGFPRHPTAVYRLPCPPIPEGANYNEDNKYSDFWCHGMFNYVPMVEQEFVDKAGWGSTCSGECGNPNRMMQCNQWVIMGGTGCSYAMSKWIKPNITQCDSKLAWKPGKEVCDCHIDLCTELTRHGCQS